MTAPNAHTDIPAGTQVAGYGRPAHNGDGEKTGWARPSHDSRKWHYFGEDARSLCGKWAYRGPLEADDCLSPDDCAPCRRALDRRLAS